MAKMTAEEKTARAQERSEKLQKKYGKFSLNKLLTEMYLLDGQIVENEKEHAELETLYDYLRIIAIPAKAEAEGVESIAVNMPDKSVQRMSLTGDMHVKVLDRVQMKQWLEDNGHGGLITETVNAQSLKSAIKEATAKGEEFPDEIFKITPFTRASLTVVK